MGGNILYTLELFGSLLSKCTAATTHPCVCAVIATTGDGQDYGL